MKIGMIFAAAIVLAALSAPCDIASDTWVATDGLGRSLPTAAEAGLPRTNRTVAVFYFINRPTDENVPGPFDVSKILSADPDALKKPDSPLWGPMCCNHWWGEPLFGYYCSNDPFVLRKHAQMLGDAGVDVIVFDVSNGPTFDASWQEIVRVFADVRASGGHTPQIAFLCPFPAYPPYGLRGGELRHLWRTLYEPGIHPELWFRWKGKPLVIAHPAYAASEPVASGFGPGGKGKLVAERLAPGHALGQSFAAKAPFGNIRISTPTFGSHPDSAATMRLRKDGPKGAVVAEQRFTNIADNASLVMQLADACPAGRYFIELAEPASSVGWWTLRAAKKDLDGKAYRDCAPCAGTRMFCAWGAEDEDARRIREFFAFRRPLAGYRGEDAKAGGWPWLEVYPQHVYRGLDGEDEMMAVSVAQNASPAGKCAMSAPGAMGRRWHGGANDPRLAQLALGPNFQEQWDLALKAAPPLVFVTGWNEWRAMRLPEWNNYRNEAGVFCDQFNPEFSRDCEPVKGFWGDAYYWQLVANVRRYKGVHEIPPTVSRPIRIDGNFDDWRDVQPEFRDTVGDEVRRDFTAHGMKAGRYVDMSGRNDIVAAKVSRNGNDICFYVRTREPMTAPGGQDWMKLFIDADRSAATGWLGYDFMVERAMAERGGRHVGRTVLRMHEPGKRTGMFSWSAPLAEVSAAWSGKEMEIAVPASAFRGRLRSDGFDFKWEDHSLQSYDWTDFTLHGDAAPNDRYNFRVLF